MHLLGTFRLILFVGTLIAIYMLVGDYQLLIPLLIVMALSFAFLFNKHDRLLDLKESASP